MPRALYTRVLCGVSSVRVRVKVRLRVGVRVSVRVRALYTRVLCGGGGVRDVWKVSCTDASVRSCCVCL